MHDKKWISTAAEIEHVMIRNAIYPPVDPDYLTLIKRVEMAMINAHRGARSRVAMTKQANCPVTNINSSIAARREGDSGQTKGLVRTDRNLDYASPGAGSSSVILNDCRILDRGIVAASAIDSCRAL